MLIGGVLRARTLKSELQEFCHILELTVIYTENCYKNINADCEFPE